MTMVRRLHREEKDEGGVRHLTKHPCLRMRILVVSRVGDGGNPNPSSLPPLLLLPRAAPPPERAAGRSRDPWGRRRHGFSPSSWWIWWVRGQPSPGGSSPAPPPPPPPPRAVGSFHQIWLFSDRIGWLRDGDARWCVGGGGQSWVATTAAMAAWTAPATAATTGVGEGAVVAPRVVASVASCWPRLDGCCG
jgi:hypothetical protein